MAATYRNREERLPAGLKVRVYGRTFDRLKKLETVLERDEQGLREVAYGTTTGDTRTTWPPAACQVQHSVSFKRRGRTHRTYYLLKYDFEIVDCDDNKALLVEHALGGQT